MGWGYVYMKDGSKYEVDDWRVRGNSMEILLAYSHSFITVPMSDVKKTVESKFGWGPDAVFGSGGHNHRSNAFTKEP